MDRFATTMIARGPTLAPDRETPTGSMHVLGLPSMEAATEFVEREPNNRAGVYAQHRIWAFENLLGRTMWEFTRGADEPRFLVIALASDEEMPPASAQPVPLANCGADLRERLMVYGALTKPEGAAVIGVALALQAPDNEAVLPLLRNEAPVLDELPAVEVHDWEVGGRR